MTTKEQKNVTDNASAQKAEADRIAAEKAEEGDKKTEATSTKEEKLRVKGLETLKSYPAKTQAFVTADGFVFLNTSDAGNHAATLEDKTVITVNKE